MDDFFFRCANMVWGVKGTKSFLFLVLHTFYKQKVSLTLQCAHVISILRCVVLTGEGYSRLGIF
jgi:hypothetical protein